MNIRNENSYLGGTEFNYDIKRVVLNAAIISIPEFMLSRSCCTRQVGTRGTQSTGTRTGRCTRGARRAPRRTRTLESGRTSEAPCTLRRGTRWPLRVQARAQRRPEPRTRGKTTEINKYIIFSILLKDDIIFSIFADGCHSFNTVCLIQEKNWEKH